LQAACNVYSIKDFPRILATFLSANPFEPALAGIIATFLNLTVACFS